MMVADPDNEATFDVIVIRSDHAEAQGPKKAILQRLCDCGFCGDAKFSVKLALEEALTNAIKHGNGGDPSKRITIRYAVSSTKAVIVIRDEGTGFKPEKIPDPTTPDRLPVPSGRGIMLIKAYMDEVVYRDNGREVRFVKHRR